MAGEAMSTYETVSVFIQATMAGATILVAILAVFGGVIRNWLFKAKLSVEVDDSPPYIEHMTRDTDSASESNSEIVEIRIRVDNSGRDCAYNCKAVADSVYKGRDGAADFFQFKSFLPCSFYWETDEIKEEILPKIPRYILICQIKEDKHRKKSDADDDEELNAEYSLYLRVDSEKKNAWTKLGRGRFIIPIMIYFENVTKPIIQHIEIYWNGDSLGNSWEENFSVRACDDRKIKQAAGSGS